MRRRSPVPLYKASDHYRYVKVGIFIFLGLLDLSRRGASHGLGVGGGVGAMAGPPFAGFARMHRRVIARYLGLDSSKERYGGREVSWHDVTWEGNITTDGD